MPDLVRSNLTSRGLLALAFLASGALSAPAAHAAGVDPGIATPVQREQAQARFARGRELYVAKRYKLALAEFRASLDIVASPNTRLYAARCLREVGQLVDAYAELGRTSVEAKEHSKDDPRYMKTGAVAADERAQLAPKLGFVTVQVDHATEATTLKIAGEEVKRAAWAEPAPVMPGTTELVVETPGLPPARREVTVAAGESQSVTLDAGTPAPPPPPEPVVVAPEPPPETRKELLPYALFAGGVGVAGMVTFAVAGSMAKSTHDGLAADCHGPCPPDRAEDIASGRTQQTVANVGLVVGLVGLAAGTTLFALSLTRKAPTQAALVVGPAWIGIGGTL